MQDSTVTPPEFLKTKFGITPPDFVNNSQYISLVRGHCLQKIMQCMGGHK